MSWSSVISVYKHGRLQGECISLSPMSPEDIFLFQEVCWSETRCPGVSQQTSIPDDGDLSFCYEPTLCGMVDDMLPIGLETLHSHCAY